MNLTFDVSTENQTLVRTDKNNIIGDSIGYLFAVFTVDDSSLIYSVLFNRAGINPVTVPGNKQGNIVTVEIPSSMLKSGTFRISIVGNSEDGQKRIPFRDESISVGPSGYNEGTGFETAEKSVYEAILSKLAELELSLTDEAIATAISEYLTVHPVQTLTQSDVETIVTNYITAHKSELIGAKGDAGKGIVSIAKTKTEGLVDTYTITYTDSSTITYTVTNGAKGDPGAQGVKGDKGDTGATGPAGQDLIHTMETVTSSGTVSKQLTANVFCLFSGTVDALTLTTDNASGYAEYSAVFTTGTSGATIVFPAQYDSSHIIGDTTITASKTYEINMLGAWALIKEMS